MYERTIENSVILREEKAMQYNNNRGRNTRIPVGSINFISCRK